MVRFTFSSYFAMYSFTFFYLVLVSFVFCYSLSWQSLENTDQIIEHQFLKVSQKALFDLGENYPYYIVNNYHYYRMLTSMVLFRNFYHFIISLIGILVFGSYIEQKVGFKRIFVLAFTSAVAGQLFGNLVTDQAKLQSSIPICGMIGYLLAIYVTHAKGQWKDLQNQKNHMLLILSIMFGLFIYMTIQYTNLSIYSHFASFVFGFIFYFSDDKQGQFGTRSILIIIGLCALMAILIVIFFLYTKPNRVYR